MKQYTDFLRIKTTRDIFTSIRCRTVWKQIKPTQMVFNVLANEASTILLCYGCEIIFKYNKNGNV